MVRTLLFNMGEPMWFNGTERALFIHEIAEHAQDPEIFKPGMNGSTRRSHDIDIPEDFFPEMIEPSSSSPSKKQCRRLGMSPVASTTVAAEK